MKGTYYTIEVAVAVLLVTSIFLLLFLTPETNPEIDRANIRSDMYKGLDILALKGSLRNDVLTNNVSSIKTGLQKYVPFNIQLHVALYNRTFQNITPELSQPTTDIIGVSYYLSGDVGNYTPKEVRVFGWGFE